MSGNHSSPTNPGAPSRCGCCGCCGCRGCRGCCRCFRVLRVPRVIERTKAISIRGNGLFHAQADACPISPSCHLSPATYHPPPVTCHPPAGQENAPIPARKVLRGGSGQKKVSFPARKIANSIHKSPQHHYFSIFGNLAFLKKNSEDKFTQSLCQTLSNP